MDTGTTRTRRGQIIDWLAANCSHYANQDNVAAGRPCGLRGAPDYILATNLPSFSRHDLDYNGGIYAQDSWTIDRLTLNYGLRMDIGRASVPATPKPGGRFVDTFEYPCRALLRVRRYGQRDGLLPADLRSGLVAAVQRPPTTCSATRGRH